MMSNFQFFYLLLGLMVKLQFNLTQKMSMVSWIVVTLFFYKMCYGISIGTLVLFLVNYLVGVIVIIHRNTTYVIGRMKCVVD